MLSGKELMKMLLEDEQTWEKVDLPGLGCKFVVQAKNLRCGFAENAELREIISINGEEICQRSAEKLCGILLEIHSYGFDFIAQFAVCLEKLDRLIPGDDATASTAQRAILRAKENMLEVLCAVENALLSEKSLTDADQSEGMDWKEMVDELSGLAPHLEDD